METPKAGIWPEINFFIKHQLDWIVVGANFAGACICVAYFLAFESNLAFNQMRRPIMVTALFFAATIALSVIVSWRWQKRRMSNSNFAGVRW